MKSQTVQHYDAVHQFEPLVPRERVLDALLEKAGDISRAATALGAKVSPTALIEVRKLLRSMNSYYTNRLEGEHTRPSDIERALHQDFSENADLARKQRLALAHIHAEQRCESELDRRKSAGEDVCKWLYTTQALEWLHLELFGELESTDLMLSDGTMLQPGRLREREVAVGVHEAPTAASVPAFLARLQEAYSQLRRGEASLVGLAAAHHRLAWVHPFLDGNGRVTRLHTHLLLHAQGLTNGLWSPLRGFARSEFTYKSLLKAADEHRRGDLDGRGNLTEAGLVDWINYTLNTCLDQVTFMERQLNVESMRSRIEAALIFESTVRKSGVRMEALNALHFLFATQAELGRADFKRMTGLGDRLATQTVSDLLKHGYLASDTAYGALRFAVPREALRFYFPALWPEAEQDHALVDSDREAGMERSMSRHGAHRA